MVDLCCIFSSPTSTAWQNFLPLIYLTIAHIWRCMLAILHHFSYLKKRIWRMQIFIHIFSILCPKLGILLEKLKIWLRRVQYISYSYVKKNFAFDFVMLLYSLSNYILYWGAVTHSITWQVKYRFMSRISQSQVDLLLGGWEKYENLLLFDKNNY